MKVLFDQGTPAPLRHALIGHEVATAYECGWSTLKNGALLAVAESSGFEVFVTTDANLRYQQNLASRKIAIVVLSTTSWPRIKLVSQSVLEALNVAAPGAYMTVAIP